MTANGKKKGAVVCFLVSCFSLKNTRLIKHRRNVRSWIANSRRLWDKRSLSQSQYVNVAVDEISKRENLPIGIMIRFREKVRTEQFAFSTVLFTFFLSFFLYFILCYYLLLIYKSNSFNFSFKGRSKNVFYNQGKWEIEKELEKIVYNSF